MPKTAATPATELADDALANEVSALGAELAAGTARLLELIGAAQERGLWGSWDARSPAEWVSWLTGYSPRVARAHVFVAEKLGELPATHAALSSGKISFCQAQAIARTERPEHEADEPFLFDPVRSDPRSRKERVHLSISRPRQPPGSSSGS